MCHISVVSYIFGINHRTSNIILAGYIAEYVKNVKNNSWGEVMPMQARIEEQGFSDSEITEDRGRENVSWFSVNWTFRVRDSVSCCLGFSEALG